MFNLTLKEKIQSVIRCAYRPTSASRERCKTIFLSAVKTSYPQTSRSPEIGVFKFRYFTRGFVTAIAIVALVGSVTTYADYADVGSESALYPLKRTSESVRLSFAGEEKKPSLHLELANRRLKEMKAVTEEARAEKLARDFTNEIKQSIVVTVSIPAAPAILSETPTPTPSFAPASIQTFQIEQKKEKMEKQKENENEESRNNRGNNSDNRPNSKKVVNIMLSDDPFCDQLEEMVSDPEPAIRAITSRDPVLHALISERCDFESFFENVTPTPGGIRLATTSLPTLP